MLYATKHLQHLPLYKQIIDLKDEQYKLSLEREYKQNSYLQKRLHISDQQGKKINLFHSFEKSYKTYSKSIEQKVYAIEYLAKERDLEPIFITLTLPSKYHPLIGKNYKGKRLYVDYNPEFEFNSIDDAIDQGYKYLNKIYRTFYKRVKDKFKNILYVRVAEAHNTLIPHFHILFYIQKENAKILREIFDNIVNEYQLSQVDFDLIGDKQLMKTNISKASKYLMKYIVKSLNNGTDYYQARIIDGWKKKHKIRIITMSNLPLSLGEYRSIYHNLDTDQKNELLNKAQEKKINIFTYILKNMYKVRVLSNQQNKKIKTTIYGNVEKDIKMFISVRRSKKRKCFSYAIKSFIVIINNQVAYEKEHYTTIQNNIGEYNNEYNY
jgi:hypothetical protein